MRVALLADTTFGLPAFMRPGPKPAPRQSYHLQAFLESRARMLDEMYAEIKW